MHSSIDKNNEKDIKLSNLSYNFFSKIKSSWNIKFKKIMIEMNIWLVDNF